MTTEDLGQRVRQGAAGWLCACQLTHDPHKSSCLVCHMVNPGLKDKIEAKETVVRALDDEGFI